MDETWITITEDHARESLADMEYETFAAAALTPGSAPVIDGSIRRVVNRVRGAVAASGRYQIGPEGTVPPELESATVHLLRREIATRVPRAGIVFDELRKAGLDDAIQQLAKVEEGKAGLTAPATVSPDSPAADTGGWGSECRLDFASGPP